MSRSLSALSRTADFDTPTRLPDRDRAYQAMLSGEETHIAVEQAVSPLVYHAAQELITLDDKGVKTDLSFGGVPADVLASLSGALSELRIPHAQGMALVSALGEYVADIGFSFASKAAAKPLYIRLMVTDRPPQDLPNCEVYTLSMLDGMRAAGSDFSQMVVQSTIFGTRSSMTVQNDLYQYFQSGKKKWVLVYFGAHKIGDARAVDQRLGVAAATAGVTGGIAPAAAVDSGGGLKLVSTASPEGTSSPGAIFPAVDSGVAATVLTPANYNAPLTVSETALAPAVIESASGKVPLFSSAEPSAVVASASNSMGQAPVIAPPASHNDNLPVSSSTSPVVVPAAAELPTSTPVTVAPAVSSAVVSPEVSSVAVVTPISPSISAPSSTSTIELPVVAPPATSAPVISNAPVSAASMVSTLTFTSPEVAMPSASMASSLITASPPLSASSSPLAVATVSPVTASVASPVASSLAASAPVVSNAPVAGASGVSAAAFAAPVVVPSSITPSAPLSTPAAVVVSAQSAFVRAAPPVAPTAVSVVPTLSSVSVPVSLVVSASVPVQTASSLVTPVTAPSVPPVSTVSVSTPRQDTASPQSTAGVAPVPTTRVFVAVPPSSAPSLVSVMPSSSPPGAPASPAALAHTTTDGSVPRTAPVPPTASTPVSPVSSVPSAVPTPPPASPSPIKATESMPPLKGADVATPPAARAEKILPDPSNPVPDYRPGEPSKPEVVKEVVEKSRTVAAPENEKPDIPSKPEHWTDNKNIPEVKTEFKRCCEAGDCNNCSKIGEMETNLREQIKSARAIKEPSPFD